MLPYECVEQNLREAMFCYSFVANGGESRRYPGLVLASTGIDYGVFNSVMLSSPIEDIKELERVVLCGEHHFNQRQIGRSYWICDDLLKNSARRGGKKLLKRLGMQVVASPPGMYAERLRPARHHVEGLEIVPVVESRARFHFLDLACTVFALPYQIAEEIYGSPSLWESPMRGYVAYKGSTPVSIISTVVAGDAIGIYSLATHPAHQRHGYAETLMRYAVEVTRRSTGLDRMVLQSTRAGQQLYSKLGYKRVTGFTVYLQEFGKSAALGNS